MCSKWKQTNKTDYLVSALLKHLKGTFAILSSTDRTGVKADNTVQPPLQDLHLSRNIGPVDQQILLRLLSHMKFFSAAT